MIIRFTDIVNGLEALGKTYKESKKVMKILRSLPSKWHTKVTTIQEAKDLTKLPMEELIGLLMTYEINLAKKLQKGEDKKKKSIALKATTKEEEESSSQESSTNTRGVKGLEEGGSPLEETFLNRNLHLMVTRKNGKKKEIWCVSNARNRDTLNMIVLSTKVKPRGE
ncbi:hypothetical protein AAG906_011557 [Vitis piasezkii]